jgi:hypothetical protein
MDPALPPEPARYVDLESRQGARPRIVSTDGRHPAPRAAQHVDAQASPQSFDGPEGRRARSANANCRHFSTGSENLDTTADFCA